MYMYTYLESNRGRIQFM